MPSLALRALAFLGISFMISACGGALGPARGTGEVGKQAPALEIQSLNGKGAASLSSLSAKITVVAFWATWCEPCKKSLSQLEELRKRSGDKLEVIGISVDDTPTGVADFAKAQGLSFPIAWDEHHTLMWRWSVEKMPSTYVLDGKGTVRFLHEAGQEDADLIAREVAELDNGPVSNGKTEVASASPAIPKTEAASTTAPVAVPVAVSDAPASTSTDETNESAKTPKPRAQPRSGKKSVTKKTNKKSAASPGS